MARRERTTGLPGPRRRERTATGRRFAGLVWGEEQVRLLIFGGSAALLLLVLGMFLSNWYSEHFRRPHEVVLKVGDAEFELDYYAARLAQFAQAQEGSGATLALVQQALLGKLEEEALTVQVAKDRGIAISKDDVTKAIAEALGVPVGGSGSAFERLYRQRLDTLNMSDGDYRRLTEAEVANKKLVEQFTQEVGDTGELLTFRAIATSSKEEAEALIGRIKAGEDLGTIAQTESRDLDSRQRDGLLEPTPPSILNDKIRDAIEGKQPGPELIGPIDLGSEWWILRFEQRDPLGTYTDTQKADVAGKKLDDALKAKRATLKVVRDLDSGDVEWAEREAGLRQ